MSWKLGWQSSSRTVDIDDPYLLDEHEKSAMLPLLDPHSQLLHLIFQRLWQTLLQCARRIAQFSPGLLVAAQVADARAAADALRAVGFWQREQGTHACEHRGECLHHPGRWM